MHINECKGKLALFSTKDNVLLTPRPSYSSANDLFSLFGFYFLFLLSIRDHIYRTSTLHRPHTGPTLIFFFPPPHFYCFPPPPPPPPDFYCYLSTTTTFLLFFSTTNTTTEVFLYVVVFRNDFTFNGKHLIFLARGGIFYGWWRCWRPVTSPTMVAILAAILDFAKSWKSS